MENPAPTQETPPAATPEVRPLNGLRWTDNIIQEEASGFPEALRPLYVWVKTYTREELNRDLDLLVAELAKLAIHHDKTTWARIFRGSWVGGNGTPVLAAEKLERAVKRLQEKVRVDSQRGKVPFVMTSVARSMYDYMDLRRSGNRANRFGVIVGPTGSGKTATYKQYERDRNHGSTSWMEAPASGHLVDFVARLARQTGLSANNTSNKQRNHLLETVREGRCFIIDNAQDLYRPGQALTAFTFLRQLQDETNCTIILSITPTFAAELTKGMLSSYFEQFVGRSGGLRKWLRLPEYPPEDDVLMIAEAFSMADARRHLKTLVKISRQPGRIRVLFDDLQDARQLATSRKERLTLDHLLEVVGGDVE